MPYIALLINVYLWDWAEFKAWSTYCVTVQITTKTMTTNQVSRNNGGEEKG